MVNISGGPVSQSKYFLPISSLPFFVSQFCPHTLSPGYWLRQPLRPPALPFSLYIAKHLIISSYHHLLIGNSEIFNFLAFLFLFSPIFDSQRLSAKSINPDLQNGKTPFSLYLLINFFAILMIKQILPFVIFLDLGQYLCPFRQICSATLTNTEQKDSPLSLSSHKLLLS